jgi:hypothetical protein
MPKEHLAMIHPMQNALERAYNVAREQAAARQRQAAEAERRSADPPFTRIAESVPIQLRWTDLGRRFPLLAAHRSRVA